MDIQLLFLILNKTAYIDPGTGSIMLQALAATIVGATIAVKLFWHRLLKFFGLRKKTGIDPANKPEDLPKKS